jgi:hypothetical protein
MHCHTSAAISPPSFSSSTTSSSRVPQVTSILAHVQQSTWSPPVDRDIPGYGGLCLVMSSCSHTCTVNPPLSYSSGSITISSPHGPTVYGRVGHSGVTMGIGTGASSTMSYSPSSSLTSYSSYANINNNNSYYSYPSSSPSSPYHAVGYATQSGYPVYYDATSSPISSPSEQVGGSVSSFAASSLSSSMSTSTNSAGTISGDPSYYSSSSSVYPYTPSTYPTSYPLSQPTSVTPSASSYTNDGTNPHNLFATNVATTPATTAVATAATASTVSTTTASSSSGGGGSGVWQSPTFAPLPPAAVGSPLSGTETVASIKTENGDATNSNGAAHNMSSSSQTTTVATTMSSDVTSISSASTPITASTPESSPSQHLNGYLTNATNSNGDHTVISTPPPSTSGYGDYASYNSAYTAAPVPVATTPTGASPSSFGTATPVYASYDTNGTTTWQYAASPTSTTSSPSMSPHGAHVYPLSSISTPSISKPHHRSPRGAAAQRNDQPLPYTYNASGVSDHPNALPVESHYSLTPYSTNNITTNGISNGYGTYYVNGNGNSLANIDHSGSINNLHGMNGLPFQTPTTMVSASPPSSGSDGLLLMVLTWQLRAVFIDIPSSVADQYRAYIEAGSVLWLCSNMIVNHDIHAHDSRLVPHPSSAAAATFSNNTHSSMMNMHSPDMDQIRRIFNFNDVELQLPIAVCIDHHL